ncbi:hypothetical protein M3J09_013183 [Ascochyta lentis]
MTHFAALMRGYTGAVVYVRGARRYREYYRKKYWTNRAVQPDIPGPCLDSSNYILATEPQTVTLDAFHHLCSIEYSHIHSTW